ncbi:MAG TPA: hypothetical protein VMF52_08045 [Steroidobacteraceae bacterium]|nr:hypothetical protein [Steroidobacteraceae bacterium]
MPIGRVVAVWMLLMLVETAHGIAREVFLAPLLGDLQARQLGVAVGSLLVFLIALATVRWMGARTARSQWMAGGTWVALTFSFEVLLGLWLGFSWHRILADYDPARGGFMVLGLVVMLIAPRVTARIRGL